MPKVELLHYAGNDTIHAQAAWVSTNQQVIKNHAERMPKLLKMLADNNHTTPFEHSWFMFRVTGDIATHIHCLKHRVGVSINTESARYKEYTEDKYHVPKDWPKPAKQALSQYVEQQYQDYHNLIDGLQAEGLTRKRAKESARFILPYAIQLNWVMSMNFRSFVHFQQLRNSEHAQAEVRELAVNMLGLVKDTKQFDYSLKAWGL